MLAFLVSVLCLSVASGRYITPTEYKTMFGGQKTPYVVAGSEGLPEFTEKDYGERMCTPFCLSPPPSLVGGHRLPWPSCEDVL